MSKQFTCPACNGSEHAIKQCMNAACPFAKYLVEVEPVPVEKVEDTIKRLIGYWDGNPSNQKNLLESIVVKLLSGIKQAREER